MSAPQQPVTADESAAILRLHHVEGWPVGTIADQLGRHHDTVERVLAHGGLPITKQVVRTRLVDRCQATGRTDPLTTLILTPSGPGHPALDPAEPTSPARFFRLNR